MAPLCVLFSYHAYDALTVRHYEALRRSNPDCLIVPLVDETLEAYLPGSVDIRQAPDEWAPASPWRRCDSKMYRWFQSRAVSAERYILLEYDCLVTVNLADAYREIWQADVAGRDVFVPGELRSIDRGIYTQEEWDWFREIPLLEPADRDYAAGLVPFACTFYSHRGLEQIVAHASRRDIFCELRVATAARKAGLALTAFPQSLHTVWWDRQEPPAGRPGVYHAVKE